MPVGHWGQLIKYELPRARFSMATVLPVELLAVPIGQGAQVPPVPYLPAGHLTHSFFPSVVGATAVSPSGQRHGPYTAACFASTGALDESQPVREMLNESRTAVPANSGHEASSREHSAVPSVSARGKHTVMPFRLVYGEQGTGVLAEHDSESLAALLHAVKSSTVTCALSESHCWGNVICMALSLPKFIKV